MSTLSTAELLSPPKDAREVLRLTRLHPAVLGLGSALILWTTFPPADWGWFAWVALVPLFLMVPSRKSRSSLYLGSWLGGIVFWTMAVSWIRFTDESAWLAWLVMALVLSLFWPAFLLMTRLAVDKVGLPLMLAAPIVWVALEYLRTHILGGFPWYYLAHSQHASLPVIQVSDLTGSLGVSFLIALVNAWVVDLLTLPVMQATSQGTRLTRPQTIRLGVVAVMLVATLSYGAFRIGGSRFREGPRVALLQSNLIQSYDPKTKVSPDEIVMRFGKLIKRALETEPRPDLLVWPETMFPFGFTVIDPGVDNTMLISQLQRIAPGFDPDSWRSRTRVIDDLLHRTTDDAGVPMLVGTSTYNHHPSGVLKYNSAVLFVPRSSALQAYHKLHLVPFGEYIPFVETLPWLMVLTPFSSIPTLNFGEHPTAIDLGPYKIATAICFEDTVPHVVRRFFKNPEAGRAPDALLNLSNDGWFRDSWEQETHLAVSVFRCVENRVPLARAANTGVSAIVDGNGRVLEQLRTAREGVVSGVLPLDDRDSFYSRWGDWLGVGCLTVTLGLAPLGWVRTGVERRRAGA